MYKYKTSGVCSSEINFELRDGKLYSVSFKDGCDGNLKAIGMLTEGMDAGAIVEKFKGLRCGRRKTSCAGQLANAVSEAMAAQ